MKIFGHESPSTYGKHARDAQGHPHTRDDGDYEGHHRREEDLPPEPPK